MTDQWAPRTDYALAALVIPRSPYGVVQEDLTNAGFESGDSGWTKGTGWSIINSGGSYAGSWHALHTGSSTALLTNNNTVPVVPGQSITANAAIKTFANATGRIGLAWYGAGPALIDTSWGETQSGSTGYRRQEVTAVAPSGATTVKLVFEAVGGGILDAVRVDAAGWNYSYVEVQPALFFEATTAGTSSTSEPTWPVTAGLTVADGTVVWTARARVSITWTARPILKSSASEPTWPTDVDDLVADGTIAWKAVSRRIEDTRCPNTRAVVKLRSKLWAVDDDIVRFCAVNNPKDWTSDNDAGYLPTGLNQDGNNEASVLAVYRGNLAIFSASTFQNWQVDEDPAGNALIDTLEGVGSIYHRAATSVGPELYFLAAPGLRSVGIAAGTDNLAAGDIGMPIDPLTIVAIAAAVAAGATPKGYYIPGAGQFWLTLARYPTANETTVFVFSMSTLGAVGAWSRYVFPYAIEECAQLGNDLYVRDADTVRKITDSVNYDEVDGEPVYFDGVVQWPWLDCGEPGQDKMMLGFDIVGIGTPTVQFGYNQKDVSAYTDAYVVDSDTLTDDMIGMELTAPTISPKITYVGAEGNSWQLQAFMLHLAR